MLLLLWVPLTDSRTDSNTESRVGEGVTMSLGALDTRSTGDGSGYGSQNSTTNDRLTATRGRKGVVTPKQPLYETINVQNCTSPGQGGPLVLYMKRGSNCTTYRICGQFQSSRLYSLQSWRCSWFEDIH